MNRLSLRNFDLYGILLITILLFPVFAFASSGVGAAVTDTVITAKIKSNLAKDEVTRAVNINVETNDGVVTLSGTVDSQTEAVKAIEIAESVTGVKQVDTNNLYLRDSQQPLTDAYITAKIKGTFLRNNLTAGSKSVPLIDVKVETQNGVVYLNGTVKNNLERTKLINLARSVEGVTEVKSSIEIKK